MIVTACVEPSPTTEPAPPADSSVRELQGEGDTYEAARDAVLALVPDGHRVIWLQRSTYTRNGA